MIVVSNTSPLTNLGAIGQFDLLKNLFGKIYIANGVWDELNASGQQWPGSREVSDADWITKHAAQNAHLVRTLRRDLDRGESESIALAAAKTADLILLDEKDGRLAAKRLGLRTMGVLGVLLRAKAKGHLTEIQPSLEMLREHAGFYLSEALYVKTLALAGE